MSFRLCVKKNDTKLLTVARAINRGAELRTFPGIWLVRPLEWDIGSADVVHFSRRPLVKFGQQAGARGEKT